MKTLSAPLAEIRINGQKVGFMKNIRIRENFRRAVVKGIGRLNGIEAPAIDFEGSLDCSFYTISLGESGLPGAINRKAPDVEAFVNSLILSEIGLDIALMRKRSAGIDPTTQLPIVEFEEFTTVRGAFLQSNDFDISEGQISGTNQSFMYLDPVLDVN